MSRMIVDCYCCGSGENEFYARENGFDMVRCMHCGLLYVRERPDDGAVSEATAIGQHHGDTTLHVDVYYNPAVKPFYRDVLGVLVPDRAPVIASWLDVGCGYGEFLECVRDRLGETAVVRGSEPNETKRNSARQRGLDVGYFDIDTHGDAYDAVSLLNVYSHLPNPRQFLASLVRLIRPGGVLLVQTGDAAGFPPSDMPKPLGLPDHLSFTSEALLTGMLEGLGLEIAAVAKYPTFPLTALQLAKETAKLFLPNYSTRLPYYLKWHKYRRSNMFLLARKPAAAGAP